MAEVRYGQQVPDLMHVPECYMNVGDKVIALARAAGLVLDEWQQLVIRCSSGFKENGNPAARNMVLVVPRQNGKGSILEAMELGALFLPEFKHVKVIIHSAHEFDTAKRHFDRIKELIEGSPYLMSLMPNTRNQGFNTSNQNVSIVPKNRRMLKFKARASKGSARGLSGDIVVFDEAYDLPVETLAAILPTKTAKPHAQTWFVSSTGMTDSDVLLRQCKLGREGAPGYGYFEWKADDGADIHDVEQWYKANPAMGYRITEEGMIDNLSALGGVAELFAREHLGLWESTDVDAAIREDIWRKNEDDTSLIDRERPIAIGIELHKINGDEFKTSIYAAGMNQMDQLSVQMMQCADGTDWVAEWVRSKIDTYTITGVGIDTGSHAKALIPELTRLGVEVKGVGTSDIGAACSNFLNKLVSFQLRHRQDSYLSSAAIGAIKRFFRKDDPDSLWAWGKRDYMTDISPLVAATLAVHVFSMTPPPPKRSGRFW
ncbi:hypothetical protein [Tsukamurella tyrosinosolvens]|uniref:hypothetical protein n=1 Tax=Tsukamurella tyrosinosolvens TaxID=57704 RepID=UPI0034619C9A